MNDNFLTKQGERYGGDDMRRAQRHFRQHVDTPHNRKAGRSCRIVRQKCYFCLLEKPQMEPYLPPAPFHHLDYKHPFRGVWCCDSHHRKIDHGSLEVPKDAIRDYTSDVEVVARPVRLRVVVPF